MMNDTSSTRVVDTSLLNQTALYDVIDMTTASSTLMLNSILELKTLYDIIGATATSSTSISNTRFLSYTALYDVASSIWQPLRRPAWRTGPRSPSASPPPPAARAGYMIGRYRYIA